MSWLFPHRHACEDSSRFDAVIAQNMKAQQRSTEAAEGATQAAEENREQVEAAVSAFKDRTERRLQSRRETLDQLLARDL